MQPHARGIASPPLMTSLPARMRRVGVFGSRRFSAVYRTSSATDSVRLDVIARWWQSRDVTEPIESLQDRYAPNNRCFGCGPANESGLRIKSRVEGEAVVADFVPAPHHLAFEGMVNGGILGTLLDCHSNWTAAFTLMKARKVDTPPCTVTAEFHVKLLAPTPLGPTLHLVARPVRVGESSVTVETELSAEGRVTATCRGVFVAVKPGHPAYHRW